MKTFLLIVVFRSLQKIKFDSRKIYWEGGGHNPAAVCMSGAFRAGYHRVSGRLWYVLCCFLSSLAYDVRSTRKKMCSDAPSGSVMGIYARRLFIFIEASIKANTDWGVFEENIEMLWIRGQRTIEAWLNILWRSSPLAGSSPKEAFFVKVGQNIMTQEEIDNGCLICIIGVASIKPAKFTIFRIIQNTQSAVRNEKKERYWLLVMT